MRRTDVREIFLKKSRPGAALIVALIVIFLAGLLASALIQFTAQYSFFSAKERGGYVDHTTLVSYTQEMKGRIVSRNNGGNKIMHAPELGYYNTPPSEPANLTREDLRFKAGSFAGCDWFVTGDITGTGEAGDRGGEAGQKVTVDVYDLFYQMAWIKEGEILDKDFPPSFKLTGKADAQTQNGTPLGKTNELSLFHTEGTRGGGETGASPEKFGAYLIRARLFDKDGKALRTADEVFLQVL